MIHVCPECELIIKGGKRVRVEVAATYQPLKSKVVFALSQSDLEVVGPLYHEECLKPK